MADTLKIHGDITIGDPASFGGSCCGPNESSPDVSILLEEALAIKGVSQFGEFELTGDSPATIPLAPALTAAHVVYVHTSAKVRVRLTSADGVTQSLPADPLLLLVSLTTPITGMDITRQAGVSTTVRVLLAEKSS